jgi:hypothetical protein
MYGASQADWCFYDNAGIVHATLSSIRVWTKCVSKARMNEVNIEKDYNGLILKTASKKVTQGYVPPMMTVVHYDDDHFFNAKIDIINYEEVADIAAIEPASRVLYELDCLRGQIRELSLRATVNVHDKPPDWKPIAPETIASTLSRLICPTK